ncbi:coatomer protein [Basidiobolus meristosporus CBS 931.73]|uniref:Coatomer subunit zeta n=1 Tax=Basidiobolus meristosporus CBS 931.73 TaxID=1314790 RepID=A0A1Y1YXH2_9FUNG|nr:coatomer protein [Basidiobolus meristosporus CBS 931.73]|eukprot:ORY02397.1 coatomer protein [Basidiobolus meristosporus CBS 931.73]
MNNLTLYTAKALVLLDSEGKRLLAKYYKTGVTEFPKLKDQQRFEKTLFEKTRRSNGEIILLDGQVVVYQSSVDVFFYLVGSGDENELLLSTVLNGYHDALSILLGQQLEKRNILDHYDLVTLALDECIDDGIVLEVDPELIVSRVSKRGSQDMFDNALTDQTLMQAYQTAKERFAGSFLKGST